MKLNCCDGISVLLFDSNQVSVTSYTFNNTTDGKVNKFQKNIIL